jgi:hypothetical protein
MVLNRLTAALAQRFVELRLASEPRSVEDMRPTNHILLRRCDLEC